MCPLSAWRSGFQLFDGCHRFLVTERLLLPDGFSLLLDSSKSPVAILYFDLGYALKFQCDRPDVDARRDRKSYSSCR